MIKVNLCTVKRRKMPRFPYEALAFVVGLVGIFALYTFGTSMVAGSNDDIKEKKENLKRRVKSEEGKINEKDRLVQTQRRIESEIERFKQLSGADLLQWSQTFENLTNVVPPENVWITNLRIDADRRVQITAYACNDKGAEVSDGGAQLTKGIQSFIDSLQRHQHFKDVFLQSATKNVYEKMPVWRFELNCRVSKELAGKM